MKKITTVVVALILILVVIKMIGTDNSASLKTFVSKLDEDKAFDDYDLYISDELTYKDIVGYTLPKKVSSIRPCITFHRAIWKGFLVAEMPEDVFNILIKEIYLQKKPELLKLWPEAFECELSDFRDRFWYPIQTIKGEYYYFEHPEEETRIAVVYGKGNFYFVKETRYVSGGKDEIGVNLYKKAKKK